MCLADLYREREPLPGIIVFPPISGIQDVMGFRVGHPQRDPRTEAPAVVCSAGVWESVIAGWQLRAYEREYCRIVQGRLRIADNRGRSWDFAAGSAFLLLRGFNGRMEVLDPVQIVFVVFTLPDDGALDWCMTGEGRTALGQERALS
jgi:uncharacterized cupin superfamily protein